AGTVDVGIRFEDLLLIDEFPIAKMAANDGGHAPTVGTLIAIRKIEPVIVDYHIEKTAFAAVDNRHSMYGLGQECAILHHAEASGAFGNQHSSVWQEGNGPRNLEAGFDDRLEREGSFFGPNCDAGGRRVVFSMVALISSSAFADVDDEAADFGVIEGALQGGMPVADAVSGFGVVHWLIDEAWRGTPGHVKTVTVCAVVAVEFGNLAALARRIALSETDR